MAITSPRDWIEVGHRDKRWAKKIRNVKDIDLSKDWGYAATGPWVDWADSVSVAPGEHLLVAGGDNTALVVDEDGAPRDLDLGDAKKDALDAALASGVITEAQRAKALNSRTYGCALWAWVRYMAAAPPAVVSLEQAAVATPTDPDVREVLADAKEEAGLPGQDERDRAARLRELRSYADDDLLAEVVRRGIMDQDEADQVMGAFRRYQRDTRRMGVR